MKRRTLEYNYDWLEWSIFANSAKLFNGTPKEISSFTGLLPSFAPVINLLGKCGEMSRLFCLALQEYLEGLLNAPKEGRKIVLNTFLADQIFLNAFDGLQPLCCELLTGFSSITFRQGTGDYYDYSVEQGFTETSCSAQRGSIGAIMAGLTSAKPALVFVGSSGPCDTNCNAVQFYAEHERLPFLTLDTPTKLTGERAAEFELKELEIAIEQIEKLTGARFNENKLRALLTEQKYQNEMICEMFELMRLVPNPMSAAAQLFVCVSQVIMGGTKIQTRLFEEVLKEARMNAKLGRAGTFSGKEKGRIFLFYIDHYSFDANFHAWCMENDYTVIPNIVWTTWYDGINYSVGHEDECYSIDTTDRQSLIRTIAAQNSRLAMNKQLRGPIDAKAQWLNDTKMMAKLMKADYLMYVGSFGCRNTWSVNKIIQREMEKLGYPVMLAFTDVFDQRSVSWTSLREQIEEFVSVRRKVA